MLDYQCVTEKAVASSRKADTRNFVCGRGSSHLRQSLAEPNDFISPFILPFISPFISPTLSICYIYIFWQAIKSPDSLQLSIIMTWTLTKIATTSPENMAVFRRSLVTVGIVNVLTMV